LSGHAGGSAGRRYSRERRADGSLDRGISLQRLQTDPPPADVVELVGAIEQFLRKHEHLGSEGDLPLIRGALDVALTDQVSYNKAKLARARAKKEK
jgi:hypothetical protein